MICANLIRVGLIVSTVGVAACERSPAPPAAPIPKPTAAIAASLPATQPVARPNAIFVVSQSGVADQPVQFPPAKLVISFSEDSARATLFSDDPPEAVKDGYTGHSFYFDITLDAASIADLPGKSFVIRKSQSERIDDNTGLYLQGGKQILQPLDAVIRIDGEPENFVVAVAGSFQVFENSVVDQLPQTVTVRALVVPEIVVKK
ncbi:MAG: hypothetical protein H7144_03595 [Burkholderiales bacterium]|nr:hypothetical protein [Phycisphaerae bacterium]